MVRHTRALEKGGMRTSLSIQEWLEHGAKPHLNKQMHVLPVVVLIGQKIACAVALPDSLPMLQGKEKGVADGYHGVHLSMQYRG
jgi:hypothetical protein